MNGQLDPRAYVILRHAFEPGQSVDRTSKDHTDWMFDNGESLWTWSSADSLPDPSEPFANRPFTQLADHRRAYLEYEGPVSAGRGHVTALERGSFQLLHHTADRFEAKLSGGRNGVLVLQRTAPPAAPEYDLVPDIEREPGNDWKGVFLPTRAEAS